MADPFTPVASGIIPPDPNQGMRSLSAILGIQKQRQDLATGQALQSSAQSEATVNQQSATENQSLARLLQDPVGNGIVDSDGNPTKNAQSIVMQAAPTTGAQHYANIVNAAKAKLDFNKSVNNLRSDERQQMYETVSGAAAGAEKPEDVASAIDNLVESKKGTPVYDDYKTIGETTKHIVNHVDQQQQQQGNLIPPGKENWRQPLLNLGMQVLGAPGVVGAGGVGASQRGVMSSGAKQQPGTFAPALQGGGFTPSGPATQTQIPPGYQMGPNGSLIRVSDAGISSPNVTGGAGGGGQSGAPGATPNKLQPLQRPGMNAPAADQQRYNSQIAAATQHVQDVSAAANDPQNGTQVTRYRNNQIERILDSGNAQTGPQKELLNHIESSLTGGSSGTPYQTIGHYLAQNSAAIASKMGVPNTNMGSETAAAAAGNVRQNPDAIKEITRVNDAINTAFDSYNKGLAKATQNGSTTDKVPSFRQAFGQNFDMNMFRYEDAVRNGDRKEVDRIEAQLGPKGMQQLSRKRKVIQSLANTGDLP